MAPTVGMAKLFRERRRNLFARTLTARSAKDRGHNQGAHDGEDIGENDLPYVTAAALDRGSLGLGLSPREEHQ
jgi:hypothetical protein